MAAFFSGVSSAIRSNLHELSFALVATVLMIFGNDINRFVKSLVRKRAFLVRLAVFIILCSVGYGVGTVFATRTLRGMLSTLNDRSLIIAVVLAFVLIGFLAEERNQV